MPQENSLPLSETSSPSKKSYGKLIIALLLPILLIGATALAYLQIPEMKMWMDANRQLVLIILSSTFGLLLFGYILYYLPRKKKNNSENRLLKEEQTSAVNIQAKKKFGTFQGVFTPTLLTILGVIMYLREGWVVGNAGVLGALGIIALACAITFFTALSMSSITTNIRIGAGGAFSIISQSLGLEAGGAIGIPLYFAQALAVAMYVFGFREGWVWIFPDHPALLVDIGTFALVYLIVNISTDFAFRIQYFIMAIIFGSIISIIGGLFTQELNLDFKWFGDYAGSPEDGFKGSNFWIVFAVYFPAVTGIMAGANMSGELDNPRENIPIGTLTAVVLSTLVYMGLAIVLALLATPEELVSNYTILIDKAIWAPIVLAGLLGATLSSALSSLVGAPRILQALGQNKILFFNETLTKIDQKGEPRNALIITVLIVVVALLMRDLNAIAPLITMFFMITYAMINVVVLVEQSLGQISFRPTLRVPIIIPLLGALGCFFVMFIINPVFGILSIGIVMFVYIFLVRRKLETEAGDTRSGMFNSLAEWAAKVVNKLPEATERSWQPNLLIPAESPNDIVRAYKVIYSIVNPKGSLKILGFTTNRQIGKMDKRLSELAAYFMDQGISARAALVESDTYQSGVVTSMQSLKAAFFRPNIIFLSLIDSTKRDEDVANLMKQAKYYGMGAILYVPFKKVGLGLEKNINLWLYLNDTNISSDMKVVEINIALLVAYLLKRNWKAKLNLIAVNNSEAGVNEEKASEYIDKLKILARLPKDIKMFYFSDKQEVDDLAPTGDINIFSIKGNEIDIGRIRNRANSLETSCLFMLDSGKENALA